MTVGKAIYYLLSNYTDLTDIVGTRIFPEVAEQDSALPFVIYSVISNEPSDTHEGPSKLDIAQVDVVMYNTDYSGLVDMGVAVRAALDRVTGTYNGVGVQSVQYTSEIIDFEDYSRAYVLTQSYDVRINRDDFEIAQGTPVTGANIIDLADTPSDYGTEGQALVMNAAGDALEWGETASALGSLTDVNLDDPHDREALVYDEETQSWINDGIGKVVIPIFNTTFEDIIPGRPLQAAGSQGDRIAVEPWDYTKSGLQYVGNAETLIPARSNGHALVYGEIRGLDTSQWPVGQLLQLGSRISGTSPFGMRYYADGFSDQPFVSAMVTRSDANTGRIFVRMWSPGYRPRLESLDDVEADNPYLGATLYWTGQDWRYRPQTSKFIVDFAQDLTEIYYYATPLDAQEYRTPRSDTPSEGNKIVRKIWYTPTAQANIDTAEWILLETLEDNALYSDVITAFTAALNTSPGGDTPISIKTTWEDVPEFIGLLDTYSGAAAAYSLRLLRADYTGDAIRVRRASDNAEQDIGFSDNTLDTAALATFCAGTDGFVKTWYDQSGNANDGTQTTTGSQPKIYDASTGVILKNALPAIDFDGTNDDLLVGVDVRAFTSFSVASADDSTNNAIYGDTYDAVEYLRYQNGVVVFRNSNELSIAATHTNQNLIYTLNDTISEIGVNGGTVATTGILQTDDFNLVIGNKRNFDAYMNGTIQEIIIYPTDQSSNRAAIETNINDHYTIY